MTKPSVKAFKVNNNELPIQVTVDAPEAAPRYTGVSIKGVEVKESPEWLKNSLLAIGLRPINNVVDVTNFVLHEMGQALHAFDADKIKGNEIHVRYAKAGEKFITLDGVEREMNERDLMIASSWSLLTSIRSPSVRPAVAISYRRTRPSATSAVVIPITPFMCSNVLPYSFKS